MTVGTMGLPAESIIREAYMMGADEGYLFPIAVGRRRCPGHQLYPVPGYPCHRDFDLILCGKQTTDGDTPRWVFIAEHMGIPMPRGSAR